jgi:UDP-N-acetylglucosamine diphosphorylase / glucose-1-phosphate thymidylyltransferase / UDP-N-acetylgalactosamine diphosphorylase / glucosamine-1-phosphate N-acetyltransferase / galactosamine-1-phosphate N-acetyltransferase
MLAGEVSPQGSVFSEESTMRLCLVEDQAVSDLEPLTLTRPVFDLLLGSDTIGSKIARAFRSGFGLPRFGAVVRPHLEDVQRLRTPRIAVNDRDWLVQGPTFVANGRWVPPAGFMLPASVPSWVGTCDGLPACALVGPDQSAGLEPGGVDGWFEEVAAQARIREVGGYWVRRPWDLVAKNAEQLGHDFVETTAQVGPTIHHLETAALIGPPSRLAIHESARIDPYTVLDTSHGPITIAARAIVQSFTRIEGPCYIGPSTQLFRANLRGGVTLGPDCRIGGEVEETIIQGHTNKYHEGFLGHSYVGEWVNLGAMTSSSDLRNDYGEVHVPLRGDPVATGLAKVGCFLGDFTRTGMGCMLNTGTVAGVMCNLLPAGLLLPKHVPSFAAVRYGRVTPNVPLEQLFITARIVMARRGKVFSAVEERLFLDLYEQTRLERERVLLKAADGRADHRPIMVASGV